MGSSKSKPINVPPETKVDIAHGALMGSLLGSAIGAHLDYTEVTPEKVEYAMQLPGGGFHDLSPGQITDEGELILTLGQAVNQMHHDTTGYDMCKVSAMYVHWINSDPFHCMPCTRAALANAASAGPPQTNPDGTEETPAEQMTRIAQAHNEEVKSHGSMTRCIPLAIWGHQLPPAELGYVCSADSALTHPNMIPTQCCAAYCIAIAHLLTHPGDNMGAFHAAADWVRHSGCTEVQEYMQVINNNEHVSATYKPESVKIPFVYAFQHLVAATPFDVAIRAVLAEGGHTGTNGSIVGGMLGALHGHNALPLHLCQIVGTCDTSANPQRARPAYLEAKAVAPTLVNGLLANAPRKLKVAPPPGGKRKRKI